MICRYEDIDSCKPAKLVKHLIIVWIVDHELVNVFLFVVADIKLRIVIIVFLMVCNWHRLLIVILFEFEAFIFLANRFWASLAIIIAWGVGARAVLIVKEAVRIVAGSRVSIRAVWILLRGLLVLLLSVLGGGGGATPAGSRLLICGVVDCRDWGAHAGLVVVVEHCQGAVPADAAVLA